MASAPQSNLPLFYNDLMPLNSRDHGKWRSRTTDKAKWLAGQHAIPLTVEEFRARNPWIKIGIPDEWLAKISESLMAIDDTMPKR